MLVREKDGYLLFLSMRRRGIKEVNDLLVLRLAWLVTSSSRSWRTLNDNFTATP
jgi:hypothetical protein